jgi:hypothetical protein
MDNISGKRKTEAQAIVLDPFTDCNLSFARLFTKKQTEVIRLETD